MVIRQADNDGGHHNDKGCHDGGCHGLDGHKPVHCPVGQVTTN